MASNIAYALIILMILLILFYSTTIYNNMSNLSTAGNLSVSNNIAIGGTCMISGALSSTSSATFQGALTCNSIACSSLSTSNAVNCGSITTSSDIICGRNMYITINGVNYCITPQILYYLLNLTSDIQAQINSKQNTLTSSSNLSIN